MSGPGLGRVKTQASAARVEHLGAIARRESQIMLRPYGAMPCLRIVFSTFRRCMSFYTARVIRVGPALARRSFYTRSAPKTGHKFKAMATAAKGHERKSLDLYLNKSSRQTSGRLRRLSGLPSDCARKYYQAVKSIDFCSSAGLCFERISHLRSDPSGTEQQIGPAVYQ
jgi:hypothetical protein